MMPQSEQNHSQQHAAGINAHVPQAGAAIRDKHLNGFIHAGCQSAAKERHEHPLFQHSEQPAKAQAQCREFREVGQFPQQEAAAFRLRLPLLKQGCQNILDKIADGPGN